MIVYEQRWEGRRSLWRFHQAIDLRRYDEGQAQLVTLG
jgi:hypothetical protein